MILTLLKCLLTFFLVSGEVLLKSMGRHFSYDGQEHAVDGVRVFRQRTEVVLGPEDVESVVVHRDIVYNKQDNDKPRRDHKG